MRALLLKDFYMAKTYLRAFIAIIFVFLILSVGNNSNMFLIMYPMIFSIMGPVSLLSYDEKFKWDRYCAAMPFTRAQIVSSKYVLTLLSCLVVFVISAVIQGIRLLPETPGDYLSLLSILLTIGLIAPSVLLPIVFKLGCERGRVAYYVIIGLVCAVGILIPYEALGERTLAGRFTMPPVMALVSILLFGASWLLSIHFYKKRSL